MEQTNILFSLCFFDVHSFVPRCIIIYTNTCIIFLFILQIIIINRYTLKYSWKLHHFSKYWVILPLFQKYRSHITFELHTKQSLASQHNASAAYKLFMRSFRRRRDDSYNVEYWDESHWGIIEAQLYTTTRAFAQARGICKICAHYYCDWTVGASMHRNLSPPIENWVNKSIVQRIKKKRKDEKCGKRAKITCHQKCSGGASAVIYGSAADARGKVRVKAHAACV